MNPYDNLGRSAFWKTGVKESSIERLDSLYAPKFTITKDAKLMTAGSCFAQHVGRELARVGFGVLDYEPPPPGLPSALRSLYGFSMFSARYGNIYTVASLLQLAKEAFKKIEVTEYIWERDGVYFDSLRPGIERHGYKTPGEIELHRACHLAQVRRLFLDADILVFTLGLTEAWRDRRTGIVYPLAPGVTAGNYDPRLYEFVNFGFESILCDFNSLIALLDAVRMGRPKLKFLLTVSPVPLTATASDKHVLVASTYSKSVLRAVAGEMECQHGRIDYFPSYEIITNLASKGCYYDANLRAVTPAGVGVVMKHFLSSFNAIDSDLEAIEPILVDAACEDALLEKSV